MVKHDFGLVGLGVMGQNFLLNLADHGFNVYGYDTDNEKVMAFNQLTSGKVNARATADLSEFLSWLETPRKIMLLVPAGNITDRAIEMLIPHIDKLDLIIDGGNSHFEDTSRRFQALTEKGFRYLGVGVSGGAEGARRGPSMMPGGSLENYQLVASIFEAVSAKVGNEPCVAFMGNGAAGHYVKMVHNGIEYGIMQLIGEVYHIMHQILGFTNRQIHGIFAAWQKGKLSSYLIEITAAIFLKRDELIPNQYLIDAILDVASQKGTGKWTSIEGLNLGVPIPTIDAGVNARNFSSQRSLRTALAQGAESSKAKSTQSLTIEALEDALYFSIISAYIQGFSLIQEASKVYHYNVDRLQVAKTWRGGCIIKAQLLNHFIAAFSKNQSDLHLLQISDLANLLSENKGGLKKTVTLAQNNEVPVIGLSSALNYYNSLHSATLPANLIQAQRDFFGAHTYQRTDRPGTFHSDWEQKV